MLSPQAKIVKRIMRATSSEKTYKKSQISRARRNFDRNLTVLFPSTARGIRHEKIAGVSVDVVVPKCAAERVIVYVHGGGFIVGSAKSHRQHIKRVANFCKAKVYAIGLATALRRSRHILLHLMKFRRSGKNLLPIK